MVLSILSCCLLSLLCSSILQQLCSTEPNICGHSWSTKFHFACGCLAILVIWVSLLMTRCLFKQTPNMSLSEKSPNLCAVCIPLQHMLTCYNSALTASVFSVLWNLTHSQENTIWIYKIVRIGGLISRCSSIFDIPFPSGPWCLTSI